MEAQATKLQQDLANGDLTNLPDLHATSAGLKAICTWYITAALEQARQCMAGHGYSAYSALPTLVADIAVNCTWEGDNTVMLLQTAQVRFLPPPPLAQCSFRSNFGKCSIWSSRSRVSSKERSWSAARATWSALRRS